MSEGSIERLLNDYRESPLDIEAEELDDFISEEDASAEVSSTPVMVSQALEALNQASEWEMLTGYEKRNLKRSFLAVLQEILETKDGEEHLRLLGKKKGKHAIPRKTR